MKDNFIEIAKISDIPDGEVRIYEQGSLSVAICNTRGQCYAIENTCTHDDGPLGEGCLKEFSIECPRHGAKFDVRTGEVLQMPAAFPIRIFETKVENGKILIKVEA